jgi:hypothetical protein
MKKPLSKRLIGGLYLSILCMIAAKDNPVIFWLLTCIALSLSMLCTRNVAQSLSPQEAEDAEVTTRSDLTTPLLSQNSFNYGATS